MKFRGLVLNSPNYGKYFFIVDLIPDLGRGYYLGVIYKGVPLLVFRILLG